MVEGFSFIGGPAVESDSFNHSGGAIDIQGSSVFISKCDFISNKALYKGGALSFDSSSHGIISHSKFFYNS